jgi:hypothetical protein
VTIGVGNRDQFVGDFCPVVSQLYYIYLFSIILYLFIVPWFCDIGNTRGRKTCITVAWRLWFHSERINNERTTADRQTPQNACKIDGCGNISRVGDPNHRTDPDKNIYNDEQIQNPVCAG